MEEGKQEVMAPKAKSLIEGRIHSGAKWAITGGVLLGINTLWQGYLDLTQGADAILHDATHPASYINDGMLFVAMCSLLLGLFALHNYVVNKGALWRTAFFISLLGIGMFALGTAGFILHNLFNFKSLLDAINLGAGIGSIVMYLGALPLGLVLLKQKAIPRSGAWLFILTLPAVAASIAGVYTMNALLGGLLMGVVYGGAWVITGCHLLKSR